MVVRDFAKVGIKVALFDVSQDGLQTIATELGALAWPKVVDLADAAAITAAIAELAAAPGWGHPDILINVAGWVWRHCETPTSPQSEAFVDGCRILSRTKLAETTLDECGRYSGRDFPFPSTN